jgi:glucose/arabinose dehydrogenase
VQQAGIRHNGGRLLFGPDGMLYVVVGETEQSQLAQDTSVNSGKVLRMTPSGGVPKDNRFKGSLVYSYGHRNSFGLSFDPKTTTCRRHMTRGRYGR